MQSNDLILDVYTVFGPTPPRGKGRTLPDLQAHLQQRGVVGAVTISTRAIFYDAIRGNEETHAACVAGGGFFLPADVLDPRLPEPLDCVRDESRILFILPHTQSWPVRYAPLSDVLSQLMETGRARTIWFETCNLGDPTELQEILRRVDYPAPVLLGGVTGTNLREALAVARTDSRILINTSGLDGVGEIEDVVHAIGADRVLFGSGAPIYSVRAALEAVRVADISDEDRKKIVGENVRALLRRANSPAQVNTLGGETGRR